MFYKDGDTGGIFHTYSTYSRGLDAMLGTYVMLDLVPKGRDEDKLPFSMQWVRHHDRYESCESGKAFADEDKPYWPKVAPVSTSPESVSSCGCGSKAGAKS